MTTGVIRRPAVAGYFYPSDPDRLRHEVDAFIGERADPSIATAALLPHGGFRHCGAVIGATLGRIVVPRRCVILGPSHTGSLLPWSLMTDGAYRTPAGDVPVDAACAEALRLRCPLLESDRWGQRGEHAIEVLLPFLQRLGPPDLGVVPIVVNAEDRTGCAEVARALAQVIRMQEEPVLLIASADLSHYEPRERVEAGDLALTDAICALDGDGLARLVEGFPTRMCGYGAAACVLEAAKELGARRGTLARYGTSADAGGDPQSVTGYAGIIIT